jgi:hypothetical protein
MKDTFLLHNQPFHQYSYAKQYIVDDDTNSDFSAFDFRKERGMYVPMLLPPFIIVNIATLNTAFHDVPHRFRLLQYLSSGPSSPSPLASYSDMITYNPVDKLVEDAIILSFAFEVYALGLTGSSQE